jgi:hypothetical protein
MSYLGGSFARLMSARSQSSPLRSIFSHSAGVSRMARCTWTSSGGFGGRPRGRFSCSMRRSVAPIYWDANIPCNPNLLGYSKDMSTEDLFSRAEALAKQRAEILKWADSATSTRGFGSPRKLRRSARAVEDVIVGIAEFAVLDCRMADARRREGLL